jgi:predicted Co/Zn/Cd cation transporter (cation efflux family)
VSLADPQLEHLERRALLVSMAATTALGALGVVWGILAGSQIVLFDGMYAIVGIGLTWLSLHASRLVSGGPTARYPFGREALTPLVVTIQAVALLATCIYGSVAALLTIVAGGSDVTAASALAYGVVSLVAATVVWMRLRARAARSELLAAEATAWRAGAALGLAMVVAFGVVLALEHTDARDWGHYADPALVIVASALLVPTPLRMIRTTLVELLEGAPDLDVQAKVRDAVTEVRRAHGLDEPYLRLAKVGRKLYVEVDFVVAGREWLVEDADAVRGDLLQRLESSLPYDLWLNIELTGDPRFAV